MHAVTMTPTTDFAQRMQLLDAIGDPQPWQGQNLPWTAADLAQIERELDHIEEKYLQHLQTDLMANARQFESLQTFTVREHFLRLFRLISDEEQWAMLQARQDRADEALARTERKQAQLDAQSQMWASRREKLQRMQGQEAESALV